MDQGRSPYKNRTQLRNDPGYRRLATRNTHRSPTMFDSIRDAVMAREKDRGESPLAHNPRVGLPQSRGLADKREDGFTSNPGGTFSSYKSPSGRGANTGELKTPKPLRLSRNLRTVSKYREITGRFVNDDRVQMLIVVGIAVNAVMMGIGTFDFVTQNRQLVKAFEATDLAFLILFTIEIAMQLFYHGFRLFIDGWLVFDFAIIALSWAFANFQIIRAFRIFRALRLITRIEVMRNLVIALFFVMPRMGGIFLLLVLIFYIFGVLFTGFFKDLFDEGKTETDYFGNLWWTIFTLFQLMTMDGWSDAAREVMMTEPWAPILFISFVVISGFVIINLTVAVFVDVISALHADENKNLEKTYDSSEETETESQADAAPRIGSGATKLSHEMDKLETQIKDLTLMQEQSLKTLKVLMRHTNASNTNG